ncbi:MAG: hypothetical protein AAB425_03105 [Bdellovibrionota bacterium]
MKFGVSILPVTAFLLLLATGCASALVSPDDAGDWQNADPDLLMWSGSISMVTPSFGVTSSKDLTGVTVSPPATLPLINVQTGPLSQRLGIRPKDVPVGAEIEEVSGQACQHGFMVPGSLAFSALKGTSFTGAMGDGGYQEAMKDLHSKHQDLAAIFDVRIDTDKLVVLSIYYRSCLIITAQGVLKKKNS